MSDKYPFDHFKVEPYGTDLWYCYADIPWTMFVWRIGAGNLNDPIGKEGTAHVLEHHLTTVGAKGHPYQGLSAVKQWADERMFQVTLGTTDMARTYFSGKAMNSTFPEMFGFMTDMVFKPKFTGNLTHDLTIVRQERIANETARQRRLSLHASEALFGNHRLGTATGFPMDEVLERITHKDVSTFHEDQYRTDNAKLLVMGGLHPGVIIRMLRAHLEGAAIGTSPAVQPTPFSDWLRVQGRIKEEFPLDDDKLPTRIAIQFAWCLPPGKRAELAIAKEALHRTLFRKVREDSELAYGLDMNRKSRIDHQTFEIGCECDPENVEKVESMIAETLADPASCLPEIRPSQRRISTELMMEDRSLSSRLQEALHDCSIFGRPMSNVNWFAELEKVSEISVAEVITQMLRPEYAYRRLIHR